MARNPKQDANLKPIKKGQLSKEEAKRRGSKGGRVSGRRRGALKAFNEVLDEVLTSEDQKAMIKAQIRNAVRGYLPSCEFILKMRGEHPDQTQVDTNVTIKIEGAEEYAD